MDKKHQFSVGVLQVKTHGSEREPIHLQEGETLRVGRVPSNDLVLDDHLVSRFHAVFNASATGIVLSDLSSLNGSFHNGRRISTPVNLQPGDVVTIGSTEFLVQSGALGSTDKAGEARGSVDFEGTIVAQMKGVVITILLADVCSFTKFSEQLSATDVAAMLQLWFSRVAETIEEFGGVVDKYIGDCVMAIWYGLQGNAPELASSAAQAALEIQQRTDDLSASGNWTYHESNPWRCRISLNSGDALLGTLGVAKARDFTVLGDTVNVAFRLNDLAGKINQDIVISGETAALIDDAFLVEPLGSTPVEGRSGVVEIFSLRGRKGTVPE